MMEGGQIEIQVEIGVGIEDGVEIAFEIGLWSDLGRKLWRAGTHALDDAQRRVGLRVAVADE